VDVEHADILGGRMWACRRRTQKMPAAVQSLSMVTLIKSKFSLVGADGGADEAVTRAGRVFISREFRQSLAAANDVCAL